ncbi:MAG: hypothetical protein K2L34_12820 [Muribaculaceae bacterium]|nr:hypothetical protein [Muribaculaceae bacterium]
MPKEKQTGDAPQTLSSSKYILIILSLAIAVIVYCFWAFPYRALLSYREQFQLFQTTGTYFSDLASRPGGIAIYIGEFLTQFFNNFWIGAAVITGLMLLFLLLCYFLINRFAPTITKITKFTLSLIPFISIWMLYGNPDVTFCFLTALLIAIATAYAYISSNGNNSTSAAERYLKMAVVTALVYWLAGHTTIVFTLLIVGYISKSPNISITNKLFFALLSLVWLAANVAIWSYSLPYPLSYQLIGIGYLMTPDKLYAVVLIVELLTMLVPYAAAFIGQRPLKIVVPTLIALELLAIVILFPKAYDKTTHRLIDYDYMVRANNWNGIIKASDKHIPDLPLTVSATNLALGMTEQLDSRAFDYYQNGVEGLLPPFAKEPLSSWTTGEIFFQLGMINSAQRFYFEGMEAIPNYNKSSRAIKRLAETAMIRGDYPLAEKYLHLLENTLFYKKWAQRNLALIKTPDGVESHPLYGSLRKRMINEDYLFSEGELDKTLGQLYLKDFGNNLAKQYLILYPLLQRDLNKFGQYMGVVTESQSQYNPLLAQQAVAFISMKNGQPVPSNIVPPMVEQSLRSFAQAWTSKNPELIAPHRRTLYYYLLSNE